MGKTNIEWCDYTFNPWIGCSKVSPGCQYCYAETLMDTRYGRVEWGPNGTRVKTSPANWKKPLLWNKQAKAGFTRYKVFCASLADVFEDRFDLLDWRDELFDLIKQTPHLDWLLLTKRPELARDLSPYTWDLEGWPENVWIGTSIENQEQADIRIPALLKIPAKIRFLSCEPLLGELNLNGLYVPPGYASTDDNAGIHYSCLVEGVCIEEKIDWVIVGGESGHNARPMHPDWVESIKDQCEDAGVPFFFKQWGAWKPMNGTGVRPGDICLSPDGFKDEADENYVCFANESEGTLMRKVGKKKAGNLLSGLVYNQFPEPVNCNP